MKARKSRENLPNERRYLQTVCPSFRKLVRQIEKFKNPIEKSMIRLKYSICKDNMPNKVCKQSI